MKSLLMMFAALALALPIHAVNLDDANRAFAAGKFQESSPQFQALLDQNGYSAPVLFDLGNSLTREGKYAPAILAYKRALWLAPGDADIQTNLQAAQKLAGATADEPLPAAKFTGLFGATGWAWLACAAWVLLCVTLLLRVALPQARRLFSLMAFVDVLVLGAAVTAAIVTSMNLREAVVMEKNAAILISPFPAAQTVFTPVPGDIVTVQKSYNDFVLVADRAGHTGWISKTQVTPVVM